MANSLTKIKDIDFKQTILKPLEACIDAQAQASRLAHEYMLTNMFQRRPNGDYAPVEMTFEFTNSKGHHVLHVPMLCLMPIPDLQIDDVTFSYIATVSHYERNKMTVNYNRLKLDESTETEKSMKGELQIKLTAGTADMPMGIAQLYQLLDTHYPTFNPLENLSYTQGVTAQTPNPQQDDSTPAVNQDQKEAIANLLPSLQSGGHLLHGTLNALSQENATVDIILKNVPKELVLSVVKALHSTLGLSLKESKSLVDNAPSTIMKTCPKVKARAIMAQLTATGAKIELANSQNQ